MEPDKVSTPTPRKKIRLTSPIYNDFKREDFHDKIVTTCRHCSWSKTWNPKEFRTNLLQDHMKQNFGKNGHPGDGKDESLPHKVQIDVEKIDEALLYLLILDNRPLNLILTPHFRYFMSLLLPKWKPFSYKTMMKKIGNEESNIINQVTPLLQKQRFFCQTSDGWQSLSNDHYIGVNVNFISEDWKLWHVNLATLVLSEAHLTGEVISQYYSKLYLKFGITEQEIIQVIDGGSNFIKIFSSFN